MSLDVAIYSHLAADPALSALVGQRIYPGSAPQGAVRPYVTFFSVSTSPGAHMLGGDGLAEVRLQLDIWADSAQSRLEVSDRLFMRLHGFRGPMGQEALDVRSVTLEGPASTQEQPTDAGETPTFRSRHDARIWHSVPVPTF